MNLDFLDTFLGNETVEGVPTGGTFTPSGLIGQLGAGVVWRLGWIENDLAELGLEFAKRVPSTTGKYRYYFTNRAQADVVVSAIGSNYPAEMCWRFEMSRDSVLNFSDESIKDKFQETISYDVAVKTPGSAKYRHEFHLVTLPYAVQAVALLSGLIKEEIFHANELLFLERDGEETKFTDQFQFEMIGNPDDKSANAMLDSVLGQRRTELWKALGEDNALAYVLDGEKFVAKSANLRSALRVFHTNWKAPVWAEMGSFYDPRVDSVSEAGKRSRIPAIIRLFASQGAAQMAAKEQLEARSKSEHTQVGESTVATGEPVSKPALPTAWAGLEDDFVSSLKTYLTQNLSDAALATNMSCTLPEAISWKKYLAA